MKAVEYLKKWLGDRCTHHIIKILCRTGIFNIEMKKARILGLWELRAFEAILCLNKDVYGNYRKSRYIRESGLHQTGCTELYLEFYNQESCISR